MAGDVDRWANDGGSLDTAESVQANQVNAVPSFDREGYQVFPGVLDEMQVRSIRNAVERALGDNWYVMDTLSKVPEIARLLAHKPFYAPLKALFGKDFIFLPECVALGDYYGPWHRDTAAAEAQGYPMSGEDFRMGTVAIYLQDNDPSGGLDLIPHDGEPISVPTKAGDMLVFDTRLEHRATPRENGDVLKRGIYFTVSANNEHATTYRSFLAIRGDSYDYLTPSFDYPEGVKRIAYENSLTLMT